MDDLLRLLPLNIDRPRSPPTRAVCQRVSRHHEVQALEQADTALEVLVVSALDDIRHRVSVALQSETRLLARVQWLLSQCYCGDIVQAGLVPFDAVRTLDVASERQPPE